MTGLTVEWAPSARNDLQTIASFIAIDSPVNAFAVVERIEARAETLRILPARGRIVPELRWHGILAFLEIMERPWRIIYRVEDRRVLVFAVLDGRRSLEDVLLDRLMQ